MTLSQRIALLTGPDRAVDAEVAVALGWFITEPNKGWPDQLDYIRINPDGSKSYPGHGFDQLVPRFTGSLDAAMSVVPEGWGWTVSNTGHARCLHPERSPLDCEAFAATPALALLSAAMMARGL